MRFLFALSLLPLAACVSPPPSVPAQPTVAAIQAANVEIAGLSTDPTTTFHTGVEIARSACQTYLNQEAAQAARANQIGVGAGALGGGLSLINPLAGTAAALFQAFLTSYQQAGVMPYSASTSSQILAAMDAYESAAGTPPDNATAVSWTDDVWFQCTPAGYGIIATKAISTATVTAGASAPSNAFALGLAPTASGRPVVKVNGR